MKQVKIKISAEGEVKFETVGYQGGECKEVDLAMIQVGSIHNSQTTAEGCLPSTTPVYNDIGIARQQG